MRAARFTWPRRSDKIYADKGSIVGSIGVIAQWVNYGDLLKWAKLKDVVIKTGEFKDTGNPARDLTPTEQAYMQALIDNMFGQFIQAVADGRRMKFDDVKSIANGKVWTGEQALSMKLIDSVGDFETAVADTAKSVGIKGEPTLVRPEQRPQNAAWIFCWGCFAVHPGARKDAGAAGWILLSVEVDARLGLRCALRRIESGGFLRMRFFIFPTFPRSVTCVQPLKFEKVMEAAAVGHSGPLECLSTSDMDSRKFARRNKRICPRAREEGL